MEHKLNRKERRTLKAMSKNETLKKEINAKDDHGWDDLKKLYMECKALSTTPTSVYIILNDQEKLKKVKDIQKVTQWINELSKEVKEHHERLELIHNKHKQWEGSTETPDELMVCLSIGEYYQQWLMSYQVIVLPIVKNILDHVNEKPLEEIPIQDPLTNAIEKESLNESV